MLLNFPSKTHEARQAKLRARIEKQKLALLVVTNPRNIFYLTGFRGSAGVAVWGASDAVLWVDPRYTLQARDEAKGTEVIEEKGSLLKAVARWLRKKKPKRVGFEDGHLTCSEFRLLERESQGRFRFEPASRIIEALRFVKDQDEIARIREASRVTVEAFEEILPLVKPGVKESDLAAEIEYRMRRKGSDGPAFDTIVASGSRGAFPHARASHKVLGKSELVIFDMGAILNGYASDMTRTLYLGQPAGRIKRLYKAVLEAQQMAVESLWQGVRGGEVDEAARRVLRRRGLSDYFTHSTGHGVGLDIHEKPRLGKGDKTRLCAGCVVTAEPGVYIEGLGGIRLEDTVVVGPEGPEVLTTAAKSGWCIP
ncbi:MAG TPA: Xaa-Pro peptidase family protein [Terriglobia bacterium]|nr:Xaa-Pro peptidase family protein [Terriglobia bacterium]